MIITCNECKSSFKVEDSLIKETGSKVRCSKCNSVFVVYPQPPDAEDELGTALDDSAAESEDQLLSSDEDLGLAEIDSSLDDLLGDLESLEPETRSAETADELDLDGIGRLMALTPNDEANSLAALHMSDAFERGELYQLPPLSEKTGKELEFSPKHLRARFLFGEGINYFHLNTLFNDGWILKSTRLSDSFSFEQMKKHYGEKLIPFFLIDNSNRLLVSTIENPIEPEPGDLVIALVQENDKEENLTK